jgi:hypothetical protein
MCCIDDKRVSDIFLQKPYRNDVDELIKAMDFRVAAKKHYNECEVLDLDSCTFNQVDLDEYVAGPNQQLWMEWMEPGWKEQAYAMKQALGGCGHAKGNRDSQKRMRA